MREKPKGKERQQSDGSSFDPIEGGEKERVRRKNNGGKEIEKGEDKQKKWGVVDGLLLTFGRK